MNGQTRFDHDLHPAIAGANNSELMSRDEFLEFVASSARYIADYRENIRDCNVLPSVDPGFLKGLLPDHVPDTPEHWQDILSDVDAIVKPGMTHWVSPHFHAYYPSGTSYASVVGEMLCAGLHSQCFSWIANPVCTELEALMLDWLARLLGLPEFFLNSSDGPGGGSLQGSASEATLIALLTAKARMVRLLKEEDPEADEEKLKARLVAYSSDQANSSVEKAGLLASVPVRLLPTDDFGRLHADTLQEAIRDDRQRGFIPCYVVATLGTTPTCAFDMLRGIGEVCQKECVWLHVDAAYAGAAFVCPEYRYLLKGIELVDSFNFNPHKWMLVNFDCSALWVRNSKQLVEAFTVDRIYLSHKNQNLVADYRHWQIPLGRRFRALKLWIVLRLNGVQGLQAHIRRQVKQAKRFEAYVKADPRFQLVHSALGLVCFRLEGDNSRTQALLDAVTARRKIYIIAGTMKGILVLRFAICSALSEDRDVDFAWEEICSQVDVLPPPLKLVKSALKTDDNGEDLTNSDTKTVCDEKSRHFSNKQLTCIDDKRATNGSH